MAKRLDLKKIKLVLGYSVAYIFDGRTVTAAAVLLDLFVSRYLPSIRMYGRFRWCLFFFSYGYLCKTGLG